MNYKIEKITSNNIYSTYRINVSTDLSCNYYQSKNNWFINSALIVYSNSKIIKEYLPNKIYVYLDNITNDKDKKKIIEVINTEYSNLKFDFLVNNKKEKELSLEISKELNINYTIIDDYNSLNINKKEESEQTITNYQNYNIEDNPFIKNQKEELEKISAEKTKEYANYNGYNKRLVDSKVRNIVTRKKTNKEN